MPARPRTNPRRTPSPARAVAGSAVDGRRVYLRAPESSDAPEFIRLARASLALHRGWVQPPVEPAGFKRWLASALTDRCQRHLVCLRDGDAIVGTFGLSEIVRGAAHFAYLGYWVGAGYEGRGLMREAMELVLRDAFIRLRLHRVEANIQPANVASIALVRTAGFRLEGFSPRYLKIAGRWRDHERWALLAEQWRR